MNTATGRMFVELGRRWTYFWEAIGNRRAVYPCAWHTCAGHGCKVCHDDDVALHHDGD